jgi:hypothetical protein
VKTTYTDENRNVHLFCSDAAHHREDHDVDASSHAAHHQEDHYDDAIFTRAGRLGEVNETADEAYSVRGYLKSSIHAGRGVDELCSSGYPLT